MMNRIMQRKKEGILTVNQICSEFHLSRSTYYVYCKRQERNLWPTVRLRGRPLNEFSLNQQEKEEIKRMADSPSKMLTVPQMCSEINSKNNRNISRSKVYRYLKKDLHYSFKQNTFAAPPAFYPIQKIVRYKVCKRLIEHYQNDKVQIFLDESGWDVNLCPSRSWGKIGEKPYRKRLNKFQRINIIMAIAKDKIIAYKAVKDGINEHHFIDFVQQLCYKLYNTDKKIFNKIILYMDNFKAHCSLTTIKFLKFTGFEILFSPIAYYQSNPIELVFAFLKQMLRKTTFSSM